MIAVMTRAIHEDHSHTHGPRCGHVAAGHGDHVDYLHNGHLHHPHDDHVDEHALDVDDERPAQHTVAAAGHDAVHTHGPGCGHESVPHGDHVDNVVDDRLHHPHGDHCDDHGALAHA
jgi:hypothetical protein